MFGFFAKLKLYYTDKSKGCGYAGSQKQAVVVYLKSEYAN